jgi:hypothetical protein
MSYYDGFALASDQDFVNRCGMCAATEGLGFEWGIQNRYEIAAAPGFSDSYASALVSGVENPGRDESVISDGELLGAVQAVAAGSNSIKDASA